MLHFSSVDFIGLGNWTAGSRKRLSHSPAYPAFQGSVRSASSIPPLRSGTTTVALPIGRKWSRPAGDWPFQSGVGGQVYAFFTQQKFEPSRESGIAPSARIKRNRPHSYFESIK